ncbi:hypothetical protein E2C01_021898 [Portunus trituberculatus]|uniref:Uncharacterized protein n=1 Tax=Portunus trituberculatus TaxID=210409 RepID=A0A5B7E4L9_PORTR|nr:hypothetical protein [Portunus trituberculatus]
MNDTQYTQWRFPMSHDRRPCVSIWRPGVLRHRRRAVTGEVWVCQVCAASETVCCGNLVTVNPVT